VNTYFMALEQKTGNCRPAEIAADLGLTKGNGDPLFDGPSFTLGTSEVTPLGMSSAYSVFANHGVRCQPIVIAQVTDRDGKDLPIPKADCQQVIERRVADSVAVILKGVIDGPIQGRTGAAMSLGRDAAGKTGTTNDSAAVWFVGFTPDIATAVATYDPRGQYKFPMKNLVIGGRPFAQVFGSTLPGPIWKMAMLGALDGTPSTKFDLRIYDSLTAATASPTPTSSSPTASVSGSPTGSASGSPTTSGSPSPSTKPTKPPKPSTSPPASPSP
jgi:membrane peptidoglycan carboxypeptidase